MTRIAAACVLIILAVMPFHAFLSVLAGYIAGHEPLWQSWKELMLIIASSLLIFKIVKSKELRLSFRHTIFWLIAAYVVVGFAVSLAGKPQLREFAFGIKTDYEFLLAFVVAYAVSSEPIKHLANRIILIGVAVVSVFGTMQAFLLPKDVLHYFGYGPATIQPYENLTAQVTSFRILSTLGGPNQLGSYLVLPIALICQAMIRKFRWWQLPLLVLCLITLWHTYSRSAWLAVIVAAAITLAVEVPRAWRTRLVLGLASLALIVVISLGMGLKHHTSLQSYVLHGSLSSYSAVGSDAQRLDSQRKGLTLLENEPLGHGLGSAGPASKYGSNYTITENYYLQIAVETGVIGVILFAGIEIALAYALWQKRSLFGAAATLGTLAGISLINFFLHGWADSSTALIFWIYAGLLIGPLIISDHKWRTAQ